MHAIAAPFAGSHGTEVPERPSNRARLPRSPAALVAVDTPTAFGNGGDAMRALTRQPSAMIGKISLDSAHRGFRWLSGVRRLNVRSGPSVRSPVTITLRRGRELSEVARIDEWILVDVLIARQRGWVYSPMLRPARGVLSAAQADDIAGELRWTAADGVRLRTGPGTQYRISLELPSATELRAIRRQDNWTEVELLENGIAGWIFDGLLVASKEAAAPSSDSAIRASEYPAVHRHWVVLRQRVQVKTGPDDSSDTLASLAQGTEFYAVARHGDWLQIRKLDGTPGGWLRRDAVERSDVVVSGVMSFIKLLIQ